jgi:type IV pilus assembly protein PilC
MPYFKCTIVTACGKKINLVKEAANEGELASSFNNTDQILVKYASVKEEIIHQSPKNYNRDIILEFTEIMSALLKAGLTVQDSVSLCASVASDSKTVWLCKSLLRSLQNGLPFHKALEMYSPSFSSMYRSLVKLGEQTGSAALVFTRMGMYLRNEKKIRAKVGNVMWYPIMVLFTAICGSACIIAFIMPRMAEIFTAFRAGTDQDTMAELARMYRTVWSLSFFLIFIMIIVIGSFFLRKYSSRFAYFLDNLILGLPVFGKYIKSIQTMDFAFAMEMLTSAGINAHTALRETAEVIKNKAYAKALLQVHSMLLKGESISCAFGSFKEFPPYIATWLSVGERTGDVKYVFTQIRSFFEEDVERVSEKLMNLLEPCFILIAGVFVLFMIMQFLLPLFSLFGRLI